MYGACLHMAEIPLTFYRVACILSLRITAYQRWSVVLRHKHSSLDVVEGQ